MSVEIKPILHIGSDDKFMNGAVHIFERAFPGLNHFLIPFSRFRKSFSYLKEAPSIETLTIGKDVNSRILEMTKDYECVILHGLHEFNNSIFVSSTEKWKFFGIIWGAEIYRNEIYPDKDFLGELTAALELPEPEPTFKERARHFLKGMMYSGRNTSPDEIRNVLKGLSGFCGTNRFLQEDLRKRGLISENYRFIPFTYYPLEHIMKGNESLEVEGNDIMLGNSASFTNNHLEAFETLEQLGIGNRSVFVPLSYGNSIYADHIEAVGNDSFADQFQSLRRFMPLEEYNRVLKVCGIVIMHQYRSQAVGNIIAMLWLGSKVYLSERNTFYDYLKSIGIVVFSIEKDLVKKNNLALSNLSRSELMHNRKVLRLSFGEEAVVEKLRGGFREYFHES